MNHYKIEKQLLLYIDGTLPEEKKKIIAKHLKECSDCNRTYEMLAQAWNNENKIGESPEPDLWFRLKDRIEKNKRNSVGDKIGGVKIFFRTSLTVAVVVVAVIAGSWIGRSLNGQNNILTEMATVREEFGLNYFDLIPPNNLAEGVLLTGYKSERIK